MNRERFRTVRLLLGVGFLALAFVSFFRLSWHSKIVMGGLEWIPIQPGVAYLIGPPPEPVSVNIEGPLKIYADDSARVTAEVDSYEQANGFLVHGIPVDISLSLSGAGLDIAPSDWVVLSRPDRWRQPLASWSIRAKESGRYQIVVRSKIEPSSDLSKGFNPASTEVLPEVTLKPHAYFELDAKPKWTYFAALGWSGFATFMGSLLTLPGIMSFLKERKERRLNANPDRTKVSFE